MVADLSSTGRTWGRYQVIPKEKSKMMGGNPRNGWLYQTRNPGFYDTTTAKAVLRPDPVEDFMRRVLEKAIEALTQALNNQSQNPQHIGEKGVDNDFRDSYV